MKTIWVVTHGKRYFGVNPDLTPEGVEQIKALAEKFQPTGFAQVIVGTGKRFRTTFEAMRQRLERNTVGGLRVKYSPLCGSADAGTEDGKVILADETVVALNDEYMCINAETAMMFIKGLESGTILFAGSELMSAFGCKSEKGRIYRITIGDDGNTETQEVCK